jgi:uncharacterized protein YjbI with pentapeptide repeats
VDGVQPTPSTAFFVDPFLQHKHYRVMEGVINNMDTICENPSVKRGELLIMAKKYAMPIFLILAITASSWSADVYVNGTRPDDSGDGLTPATAKKTLFAGSGVLNLQGPGSTLHLQNVQNYDENMGITITANGTAVNPIIILSDPIGSTLRDGYLDISGQHVIVRNLAFDVRGNHEACVVVRGSAADCTLDGCTFTGVAEGSEHFNTESIEAGEDDVAPVQIMGASGTTIQDCDFNVGAGDWDWAVLYPSATGPSSDLTVDGCTVDAGDTARGVGVFRAVDNIQVLDCAFNSMEGEAFQLSSGGSGIDSGTSDGILIQDCVIDGFASTSNASSRGSIRIVSSAADNFTVRRCESYANGTSGQEFIVLTSSGCSVANTLIEDIIYERSPTTTNAYHGAFAVRFGAFANGVTIDGASVSTSMAFQFYHAGTEVHNLVIRDSTSHNSRIPGYVHLEVGNGAHVYGMLVEDCYFRDSNGGTPEIISIYSSGTYIQDATFINVSLKDNPNTGAYTLEIRGGAVVEGLHMENCDLDSGSYAMQIYDTNTNVSDVYISNCTFKAAQVGDGTPFVLRGNASVDNCVIEDCTFIGLRSMAFWTGVFSDLTFRNCVMDGELSRSIVWVSYGVELYDVTFEACTIGITNAGFGFTVDTASVMDRVAFNNCSFPNGDNSILAYGSGTALRNTTISNCELNKGIRINGGECSNLSVSDSTIADTTSANDDNVVYISCEGDNNVFQNVTFNCASVVDGIRLLPSGSTAQSGWQITDCTVSDVSGTGLYIAPGLLDAVVSGCAFSSCTEHGIDLQGSNLTVSGCTITNVTGTGVNMQDNDFLTVTANIQVVTNTLSNCGTAILVEGSTHTIGWNKTFDNTNGILVRSGLSGILSSQSNTKSNLITRNCVFGGIGSATGLYEALNDSYVGDPGPSNNIYLNNTVTDWGEGSDFIGGGNRIQNNIFAFNAGSGLKLETSGLIGLQANFNCAHGNAIDFDDIAEATGDLHVDPQFSSRDPANANFYLLIDGSSACINAGTTNGNTADGVTDMGCRESGTTEVRSWRLY